MLELDVETGNIYALLSRESLLATYKKRIRYFGDCFVVIDITKLLYFEFVPLPKNAVFGALGEVGIPDEQVIDGFIKHYNGKVLIHSPNNKEQQECPQTSNIEPH